MIPATYEYGFFVYLTVWLVLLIVLWSRELWRSRINAWSLSEGRLCVCDDCHFAFLVKPRETVARCPRCNQMSYVRRKKRR